MWRGQGLARGTHDYVQSAASALGAAAAECGLCCSVAMSSDPQLVAREMEPAKSERLLAVAVGEQSEVADLDEAGGQHMEQEAADELDRIEGHDLMRLLCLESRQRKRTWPLSRSSSLPLAMATRWV